MTLQLLVLNFLVAIQSVESNNGKMLNHPEVTNIKSIQFGDSAIGKFALMPKTITMYSRDPLAVERFKRDSNYQFKIAYKHAIRVLAAAKGCAAKASVLWLRGPSGRVIPLDYQTARYKRFYAEFRAINGTNEEYCR